MSSGSYRASSVLALAAWLLLSSCAMAVEVFTTPEARKKWEEQQAADLKAKKERDKADKAHKKANQEAKDAGMKPLPQAPLTDSSSSSPQPSFSTPIAPALPQKEKPAQPTDKSAKASDNTADAAQTKRHFFREKQAKPAAATVKAAAPASKQAKDSAPAVQATVKPAQDAASAQAPSEKKRHFWRAADKTASPGASVQGASAAGLSKAGKSAASPSAAGAPGNSANPFPGSTGAEPTASIPKGAADSGFKTDKTRAGRAPTLAWINPEGEPKAVLLCVHGLGLNSKSYEDFGKRMAAQGVATYAVDVRGFGSWMNQKGTNQDLDFDYCLYDVAKTLEVLHKVHPGLKVFLLGESMGGAIALRVCAKYPDLVDGLISCVPSGDRFGQKKTELQVALRFLHGANKQFNIGQSVVDQASKGSTGGGENEQLKAQWLADEFNRKLLSPKQLIQFQHFMNENKDWARKISDRPIMMLQGDDDNLVKATGTLELLTSIPVQNHEAVLLVIRDAKHLIFEEAQSNDLEFNNKVMRWVNDWIDDHLKKPQAAITQANPTP